MGLQSPAQFRRHLVEVAVKQFPGRFHDDDPAVLLLRDAAQEQVFLPQPAKPAADVHGLIDGSVQAFHAGCDQESVKAHLPGDGVCDHIADYHPVAALLEPLQCMGHFFGAVHREDVQVEAQQAAQGVGRLRDAGKAHNGIELGIIFCQLHGAQYVVDRDLDIHHRQVGHLPDQSCCAAAGDDAVVSVGRDLLHDGLAVFKVAGVDIQFHVGICLCGLLHGGAHTVVGGDAEDSGVSFNHNRASVHL